MNVINDIRLTKILEILLNLQYDNYKDISNIHSKMLSIVC